MYHHKQSLLRFARLLSIKLWWGLRLYARVYRHRFGRVVVATDVGGKVTAGACVDVDPTDISRAGRARAVGTYIARASIIFSTESICNPSYLV